MSEFYLLDENKNPYAVDCSTWGKWMEENKGNKHVRYTSIKKYNVDISTVFLGLDHGYPQWSGHTENYRPVLFETMIFWTRDQELDEHQERYHTWEQALNGHRETVRMVIASIRKQLQENPNKIFCYRPTKEEKFKEFVESIEKLSEIETKEGTPEHNFIVSSLKNLERYKKSQEDKK